MTDDERSCWLAFSTEENTLPFVKVLEMGKINLYQFKHISIQEALFVIHTTAVGASAILLPPSTSKRMSAARSPPPPPPLPPPSSLMNTLIKATFVDSEKHLATMAEFKEAVVLLQDKVIELSLANSKLSEMDKTLNEQSTAALIATKQGAPEYTSAHALHKSTILKHFELRKTIERLWGERKAIESACHSFLLVHVESQTTKHTSNESDSVYNYFMDKFHTNLLFIGGSVFGT
jgi:hypothetical protein